MSPSEVFDDIIQSLDPDEVPIEFILLAKVVDHTGKQSVIKGPEQLAKVIRGPNRARLTEALVMYDSRKIRRAIAVEVNAIYDAINTRLAAEAKKDPDEQ